MPKIKKEPSLPTVAEEEEEADQTQNVSVTESFKKLWASGKGVGSSLYDMVTSSWSLLRGIFNIICMVLWYAVLMMAGAVALMVLFLLACKLQNNNSFFLYDAKRFHPWAPALVLPLHWVASAISMILLQAFWVVKTIHIPVYRFCALNTYTHAAGMFLGLKLFLSCLIEAWIALFMYNNRRIFSCMHGKYWDAKMKSVQNQYDQDKNDDNKKALDAIIRERKLVHYNFKEDCRICINFWLPHVNFVVTLASAVLHSSIATNTGVWMILSGLVYFVLLAFNAPMLRSPYPNPDLQITSPSKEWREFHAPSESKDERKATCFYFLETMSNGFGLCTTKNKKPQNLSQKKTIHREEGILGQTMHGAILLWEQSKEGAKQTIVSRPQEKEKEKLLDLFRSQVLGLQAAVKSYRNYLLDTSTSIPNCVLEVEELVKWLLKKHKHCLCNRTGAESIVAELLKKTENHNFRVMCNKYVLLENEKQSLRDKIDQIERKLLETGQNVDEEYMHWFFQFLKVLETQYMKIGHLPNPTKRTRDEVPCPEGEPARKKLKVCLKAEYPTHK